MSQASDTPLEILGTPYEITQNIEKRIHYKMRFPLEIDDRFLDQIKRETIEAIKPYGYFSPKVHVFIAPEDEDSHIIIDVELNELAYIRSIEIDYTSPPDDPLAEQLLQSVAEDFIKHPFNNASLNEISEALKNEMISLGYNDVVITRGYTSVHKQRRLSDVTYLVTLNEKNLFGTITYPESHNTYCFNRFHAIQEGAPYDPDKLKAFQKNMMKSGQYAQSTVKTVPRKNAPHIQDVIVEYTPIKPAQLFVGIGATTNARAGKLTPQAQASINLNNLGGCGNAINMGIKGAQNGGKFHINALFPQHTGMDDFIVLSGKVNRSNFSDNDSSDYLKTTAMLQRYLSPFIHQVSMNYLIESSSLNDNATHYTTKMLYPKYRVIFRKKRNQGEFLFKAKAIAGSSTALSDIDFFQFGFTASLRQHFYKFYAQSQLSYGKIYTQHFSQYPLSMQYYLGGSASNRGLEYQKINEGKSYLLSRNQLQLKMKQYLYVGGFFDTGFCDNPSRDMEYYPAFGFIASAVTGFGIGEFSVGRLVDGTKWVILLNVVPGADVL